MFLGSYHMDCALHELKGKPYSKKKLFRKHIFQSIAFILLVGGILICLSL